MDLLAFVSENIFLVGLLAVLVAALVVVEGRRGGKALSYHEVTRLLNSDQGFALDVRDKSEYENGHIAGAINIPFSKLKDSLGQLNKHKSKTIVVIDKIGQQAGSSVGILTTEGYTATRLRGGMSDWQSNNLPTVKS